MFGISVSLILSLLVVSATSSEFRKNCRQALRHGRNVIETAVPALVQEETARFRRKFKQRMTEVFTTEVVSPRSLTFGKYVKAVDDDSTTTPNPCPQPNSTMFTTIAPTTVTTTTHVTSCSSSTLTTVTGTGTTTPAGTATAANATSGGTPTSHETTTVISANPTSETSGTSKGISTTVATSITTAEKFTSVRTTQGVPSSSAAQPTTAAPTPGPTGKVEQNDDFADSQSTSTIVAASTSGQTTPAAASTTEAMPACSEGDIEEDLTKPETSSFVMPTLYSSVPELDPFHNWMSSIYEYMHKESEICDSVKITDLNSITEDQLYGFLATLSAAHPGPFCSLCDRFIEELIQKVLAINPIWGEDVQLILRLLYAHVPTAKGICSAVAPACYEDYEAKTRNLTEATICLECTACMTAGNIIQHSFLLDKQMVADVLRFLRSSLFHNTCAELCLVWQPLNLTLFPNGFTYEGCMDFLDDSYYEVVDIATVILRPERFCSLELEWCELNEMPNIMHCLYELCRESLGDTPQAKWICNIIPDTPDLASDFLNIAKTKQTKTWKSYHDKFLSKVQRDEL